MQHSVKFRSGILSTYKGASGFLRMDRIYVIREWLRRELERVEREQGPFSSGTEYEALLRELLAVIDRHTFKMK